MNDLPGLHQDVLRVLELAADNDVLESAQLVVGAGVIVDDFTTTHLRPEPLFKIARQGRLETALARVEPFDIEEHWKQVTSLTLAWLAAAAQPEAARAFHAELGADLAPEPHVVLLWKRMDTALNGAPSPQLDPLRKLPPEADRIVAEILKRIGGADADVELLERHELQLQPQRQGHAGAIVFPEPGYLSQRDGPVLVSYASKHPEQGRKQLVDYIRSHQTYAYAYYRRQSLWHLL